MSTHAADHIPAGGIFQESPAPAERNRLIGNDESPQAGIGAFASAEAGGGENPPAGAGGERPVWYALRDLKRANALRPAYHRLLELGFEAFTPLKWQAVRRQGRTVREERPVISDLLFVRSTRPQLDPVVDAEPTLQYRFVRGGAYREAMTVRDVEMDAFIRAVRSVDSRRYYSPSELTPSMLGRTVRIVGGPLDGVEAPLLKLRGARTKRIVVEIPSLLAACVEVRDCDYLQIVG